MHFGDPGKYFAARSKHMEKILLIEDEEAAMGNLKELLGLSNYAVSCAVDGKQGIRTAIAERPDLIICDAVLPVLDGFGVIHALQQFPETRSIPVIMLTTISEKDDFRKAMMAGAEDFLPKPFDGVELLRSVDACLTRRRRLRSGHPEPAPLAPATGTEYRTWSPGDRDVRAFKRKAIVYAEGQR